MPAFAGMTLVLAFASPPQARACIGEAENNQRIAAYYKTLTDRCADPCCRGAVRFMQQNGYEEAIDGLCPNNVKPNRLMCATSLTWCEKATQKTADNTDTCSSHK